MNIKFFQNNNYKKIKELVESIITMSKLMGRTIEIVEDSRIIEIYIEENKIGTESVLINFYKEENDLVSISVCSVCKFQKGFIVDIKEEFSKENFQKILESSISML